MDHEGPNPKINTQKRATAADQVKQLHEEYEARGKPSSDKITPVLTHNEKYPKLRKEIGKRKSIANVTGVDKARLLHASRSTNRAGQRKHGRRNKNLSRVTKKRSHVCNGGKSLPTKLLRTKSCQFSNYISVINRRIGTDAIIKMAAGTVTPNVVDSETIVEIVPTKPKPTKPGSTVSSIGSRVTSVSSLNSYYSMDLEPMGRRSSSRR